MPRNISQIALLRMLLAIVMLSMVCAPGGSARAEPGTPPQQPDGDSMLYLPLVRYAHRTTPLGVQIVSLNTLNSDQALQAESSWVRSFAFDWSAIEPALQNPRVFDWSSVDESGLAYAGQFDVNLLATIRFTPVWAQKIPGYACGPVAKDRLDEFAGFVETLVQRYSAPPYNIHYWEIGNEPDVDPSLVSGNSAFGCWGNMFDSNYGGGYYASMLQQVYPAVKRADPRSKVVIGGLLMDCDPVHPPKGKNCTSSKFINGILANGGGPYFDYANFHGYAYFDGTKAVEETFPNWAQSGGTVFGKLNYLRSIMAKYGVDKPVLLTEASLVCPESNAACQPPSSLFLQTQADYLVSLYARTWAAGIQGVTWYSLDDSDWRSSSLKTSSTLKPSYYAYLTMGQKLYDSRQIAQLTGYSGLQGYEFTQVDHKIWVLWSQDGLPHALTLPSNWLAVSDKFGSPIPPVNGQVTITSPVYIDVGN